MSALFKRLFQVKEIGRLRRESEGGQSNSLKRTLKVRDLVGIGLGGVIGSGIFVTAGMAAVGGAGGLAAGPSVMLSFILVAAACMFCVLCYAEFSSIVPAAGSAYTYAYASLGEGAAWFIGLNLVLEYAVANAAVAISWAGYLSAVCEGLGLHIPDYLLNGYFAASPELAAAAPKILGIPLLINLPALLINLVIAAILIRGIRQSSTLNNFMVIFKIAVILFLICAGACYINPDNWSPFFPNGLAGVQAGAAIVFFSYIGFDSITTVAEEAENPNRDLPRGMIWTMIIAAVLYFGVAAVMTGMVPYTQLDTVKPMATAFRLVNAPWAAMVISVGALAAMTAVLFVFLIGQPRIFFVMSRDGLLPEVFSRVHERYRTPYMSTVITAAAVALASGLLDISALVQLCNIGTFFIFITVCVGVIILRRTKPELERPFKTPFMPYVPIAGIIFSLFLCGGLSLQTWINYALWLLAGAVFYMFYSYKHSRIEAGEPQ